MRGRGTGDGEEGKGGRGGGPTSKTRSSLVSVPVLSKQHVSTCSAGTAVAMRHTQREGG